MVVTAEDAMEPVSPENNKMRKTEKTVLFVCYSCGTPESPLPLNLGQGSDSPGEIAATRHVLSPQCPVHNRHIRSLD